jgi:predicted nucleotidyltransferase
MRLSSDLREFLELLNSRGVEYVIVGAHSLAFHGRPRYTGDLDILVRAAPENAGKLVDLFESIRFRRLRFQRI